MPCPHDGTLTAKDACSDFEKDASVWIASSDGSFRDWRSPGRWAPFAFYPLIDDPSSSGDPGPPLGIAASGFFIRPVEQWQAIGDRLFIVQTHVERRLRAWRFARLPATGVHDSFGAGLPAVLRLRHVVDSAGIGADLRAAPGSPCPALPGPPQLPSTPPSGRSPLVQFISQVISMGISRDDSDLQLLDLLFGFGQGVFQRADVGQVACNNLILG